MADIYLDAIDVCHRLMTACKNAGGQKAWSEANGVSPAYVSDVLHSRREPGPALLEALGLVRIVRYRAKPPTAPKGKKGAEA